jgi:hypothetical protein
MLQDMLEMLSLLRSTLLDTLHLQLILWIGIRLLLIHKVAQKDKHSSSICIRHGEIASITDVVLNLIKSLLKRIINTRYGEESTLRQAHLHPLKQRIRRQQLHIKAPPLHQRQRTLLLLIHHHLLKSQPLLLPNRPAHLHLKKVDLLILFMQRREQDDRNFTIKKHLNFPL